MAERIEDDTGGQVVRDGSRGGMSVPALTLTQRNRVEEALLRALQVRYPGRAISIDWDGPDADISRIVEEASE
jgi:hypothetical protein